MKIKIIWYNIRNGFSKEQTPFIQRQSCKKAVSKLLNKENPDILVLGEAFFWSFAKTEKIKDYNKFFDKLYRIYAPAEKSFKHSPILISKFKINYYKDKSKYHKQFLQTKMQTGEKEISIDTIHPSPQLSKKENMKFLKRVTKGKNGNYILVGDFNVASPEDKYDKKKLIKNFEEFLGKKAKSTVDKILDKKTVNTILKNDLIDTYKFLNKDFDFTIPTDDLSKDKSTGIRMDYIFCSNDFKILESGIIKNEFSEKGSDHYPIYAILEI